MSLHHFPGRHRRHLPSFLMGWVAGRMGRKLRLDDMQRSHLNDLFQALRQVENFMGQIHRDRHAMIADVLTQPTLNREEALQLLLVPERAYRDQLQPVVEVYGRFHDSLDGAQRSRLVAWLRHCG